MPTAGRARVGATRRCRRARARGRRGGGRSDGRPRRQPDRAPRATRAPAARHYIHDAQSSQQAVSGRRLAVTKDYVTRLFATEGCTGLHHLFEHVLIAHIGAHHVDTRSPKCDLKPHIGHSCRDHGVPVQQSARMHVASHKQQNCVAINYLTSSIAEQRTVSITVERDSQIKTASCLRHLLRYRSRMKRTATFINVLAVRRGMNERRLHAACAK